MIRVSVAIVGVLAAVGAGLGWCFLGWGASIDAGLTVLAVFALAIATVWKRGRRVVALFAFRLGTGLTMIEVAVLGWATFNWEDELAIAVVIMGGFVVLQTLIAYVWARPYFTQAVPPPANGLDHAPQNAYADAAKVAITTQGVVLGLISFSQQSLSTTTVKVGAAALATGVLIATVLYLLVAQAPPPDKNRQYAASYFVSLMLWALAFGLVCVVAGSWKAS